MKVLIIRPDKIGDVVLSSPVFGAVKKKYPDTQLFALTSRYAHEVLFENPYIEKIITWDGKTAGELASEIKNLKITHAVALFSYPKISFALAKANVPRRIISGFKWHQIFFPEVVYLRRSQRIKKEWEYNLELVSVFFPGIEKNRHPELFLSEKEKEFGLKITKKLPRPLIGIYPGGGAEKKWPPDFFSELCRFVEKKIGFPLVLWGPSDAGVLRFFEKRWILERKLNIRELMAVIYNLDGFVSNNTGPMHIAAAFEKPLVQIFDPRKAVDPKRWGHEYPRARILLPNVPPCTRCNPNCPYYDCMIRITPKEVFKKLLEVLR